MRNIHALLGALLVTASFAACGDDDDDGGADRGGTSSRGGSSGQGGSRAGEAGDAGTSAGGVSGRGGTGGRGGTSGAAGAAGTEGGAAGDEGGMGGEAGEGGAPQGGEGGDDGVAGMGGSAEGGMGGTAGTGGEAPTCDPVPPPELFVGELSGYQEVPANTSDGTGHAIVELSDDESMITVSAYFSGLSADVTAGHVHGPAPVGSNAAVLFNLMPPTEVTEGSVVGATFTVTPSQVAELRAGLHYVNIHTEVLPAGEIRGQLLPALLVRSGTLSSEQEVPTNDSTATGRTYAVLFPGGTRAAVSASYSGLTTDATAGHVHGPAAFGVNAGILFDLMPPAAQTGSIVHRLWSLTSAQAADLLNGLNYVNIHTGTNPGGEIRAQLLPACP